VKQLRKGDLALWHTLLNHIVVINDDNHMFIEVTPEIIEKVRIAIIKNPKTQKIGLLVRTVIQKKKTR